MEENNCNSKGCGFCNNSYTIRIEDLVGNALIETIERTNNRSINFSQLDSYGEAILKDLKDHYANARIAFNQDETNQFLEDYSKFFLIKETNNEITLSLKDNFSTKLLRSLFRINLPLSLLKVFTSKEAIEELIK